MESRAKKRIGFELVVFSQIQPHKIRLSDLRSPNSQIQYTPNTLPIKDGLRYVKIDHLADDGELVCVVLIVLTWAILYDKQKRL